MYIYLYLNTHTYHDLLLLLKAGKDIPENVNKITSLRDSMGLPVMSTFASILHLF